MFHALLITGYNSTSSLKLAQKLSADSLIPAPDVFIVDSVTSIGLAEIKKVTQFLSRKPLFKANKIAFFPSAEKLTLAAQNAFLKTLEEPPAHSLIILIAPHPDRLLATLTSRCQTYSTVESASLDETTTKNLTIFVNQLQQSSPAQKIILAGQLAVSKTSALEFCQNLLIYLRHLMIKKSQLSLALSLRQINQAIVYLNQNVNPKLCMENLFLQLLMC